MMVMEKEGEGVYIKVEVGDNPQEVIALALREGAYNQGETRMLISLLFPEAERPVLIPKGKVNQELFEWNNV